MQHTKFYLEYPSEHIHSLQFVQSKFLQMFHIFTDPSMLPEIIFVLPVEKMAYETAAECPKNVDINSKVSD